MIALIQIFSGGYKFVINFQYTHIRKIVELCKFLACALLSENISIILLWCSFTQYILYRYEEFNYIIGKGKGYNLMENDCIQH